MLLHVPNVAPAEKGGFGLLRGTPPVADVLWFCCEKVHMWQLQKRPEFKEKFGGEEETPSDEQPVTTTWSFKSGGSH
jgi:hypothetical protein